MAFTLLLAGFVLASAAVWFAGIRLSNATDILSMRLFGATVLAAAPSLPEVSTGLQSLKLGDYQFAVSDIFGGNAFLAVLFLPATLISGSAVLPQAHASDVYLTALAILLTIIYMGGLLFRPQRQWAHFGPDSIAVVAPYALGIAGLAFVTQ